MLEPAPIHERHGVAPFVAILLALAIATALALLLQPARPPSARAQTQPQAPPEPFTALIGDSITDQARQVFTETLGPERLDIRATAGKTFADQLDVARDLAARRPRQVFVNLGSNDVLLAVDPATTMAALHEMVDLFPAPTCIHLVTVNETFFAIFPDGLIMRQRSRAINNEIHRLAVERHIDVVDWARIINDAIETVPPRILTADTVHPTLEGQRVLADLYRDGASRSCA